MKPARGTRADNMWSTYRFVDTWMCTVPSNLRSMQVLHLYEDTHRMVFLVRIRVEFKITFQHAAKWLLRNDLQTFAYHHINSLQT